MDCCSVDVIDSKFDKKKAKKDLKSYRTNGLNKTTRILVEALINQGIAGLSLLDIGGGIGAIQHELLKAGVVSSTNLEASSAYIEACKQEAERQGYAEKITHIHGDFAQIDDVPSADIVTLERVICCYPDWHGLVTSACKKADRYIGFIYPRETWWVKFAMITLYNLRFQLQNIDFRVFMHPTTQISELIVENGFNQIFFVISGAWQIYLYERNGAVNSLTV